MKTSQKPISANGGAGSTSSREDSLASPSVMPGSDEARMMTATSGRLCTDVLTKCDPIGSCVRTLLESSRWSSRATLLKWRLKKVYSTRLTHFTDTDSTRPLPLNASAKTLRVTDMPSKRLLFQLAPLTRRTDETECSSSATVLLQTPTTVQTDEPPEKMRERATHNGYKNGTKFGSLTSQLKYDPRLKDMFPTQSARDWKGKTNPGVVKQGSGCIYGETLPDAIDRMMQECLLPTPRSCTSMGASLETDAMVADNRNPNLEVIIARKMREGLLPTPRINVVNEMDLNNPALAERNKSNLEEEVAKIVVSQGVVDGMGSRLSPLFTEEMMGFPYRHTTMPYIKREIT